jgi:hypothetical protein
MSFLYLLWIPALVLLWRTIVSKQGWRVRIGAATAAMLSFVGSVTAPPLFLNLELYRISAPRDFLALAVAAVGPIYLLLWARKSRGRGRSKTVSMIAGIFGLVPILGALAVAFMYTE